jgi:hypothetical protein
MIKVPNLYGKHHKWYLCTLNPTSQGFHLREAGFPHQTYKKALDSQPFRPIMWSKVVESGKS